jgi:hypothetical protein
MDNTLLAATIHDDNKRISVYADQLLTLVKKEFRTKKIDVYDYERFINVLTCLNLQTEETRKNIETFIQRVTNKRFQIDIRV